MALSLGSITIDSTNPERLAQWWAEQLGLSISGNFGDEFYFINVPDRGIALSVQQEAEPTPGKNRIHIDFRAADPCAEAARLIAAGATEVDEHRMGALHWHTLADPDGNRFCVSTAN